MKKKLLGLILALVLCIPMFVMQPAEAAMTNMNLKAQWSANSEPDVAGYKIANWTTVDTWYAGSAAGPGLLGDWSLTAPATATLITNLNLSFVWAVTSNTMGTLTFHLICQDTLAQISPQATATYNYNVCTPPAAPTGFTVIRTS